MKNQHPYLESAPRRILKIGLPVIIIYLSYVIWYIKPSGALQNTVKLEIASAMLEHIVMALAILVCGSFILDLFIKRRI